MKNGIKVKTNDTYYEQYTRRVFGIIENEIDPNNEIVTCVRVLHQQGKAITEHHEKLVVMMVKDLEIVGSDED